MMVVVYGRSSCGPEPEVINISPEGGVVSTLQEGKVECLSADTDHYFSASIYLNFLWQDVYLY